MEPLAMTVEGGHATEKPADAQAHAQSQKAIRSNAVIILERDGSLVRCGPDLQALTAESMSAYTELPAHLVRQQHNLIDRVIDFAFDTLGLTSLELRVSEQDYKGVLCD